MLDLATVGIRLIFWVVGVLIVLRAVFSWVRFIPNNRIGIIEKRWSGKGSIKSRRVGLNDFA